MHSFQLPLQPKSSATVCVCVSMSVKKWVSICLKEWKDEWTRDGGSSEVETSARERERAQGSFGLIKLIQSLWSELYATGISLPHQAVPGLSPAYKLRPIWSLCLFALGTVPSIQSRFGGLMLSSSVANNKSWSNVLTPALTRRTSCFSPPACINRLV